MTSFITKIEFKIMQMCITDVLKLQIEKLYLKNIGPMSGDLILCNPALDLYR